MDYDLEVYQLGEALGKLDEYDVISSVWTEVYYGADELKLTANYSDKMVNMLKKGNIIIKTDTNRAVQIQSVELSDDINTAKIVVVGYDYKKILDDRVAVGLWKFRDPEVDVLSFVQENLRGLNLKVAEPKGYELERLSYDTEWRTAFEMSESALARSGLGGRVRYIDGEFWYDVFKGEDKTTSGVISYAGGTLLASNWLSNNFADKTCAYVRGESNILEIVGDVDDSPYKKEVLLDMTGQPMEFDTTLPNGDIVHTVYSEEEYRERIRAKGLDKLAEYGIIEEFDLQLSPDGGLQPMRDFYLGDWLLFRHDTWDVSQICQVLGLSFVWDNTGKHILVTLG